jgi:hypothetical protein
LFFLVANACAHTFLQLFLSQTTQPPPGETGTRDAVSCITINHKPQSYDIITPCIAIAVTQLQQAKARSGRAPWSILSLCFSAFLLLENSSKSEKVKNKGKV